MMSRLASTPDGILVSLETINDYSLHPGDLLRLRVLDQSTGQFRVAPFHVIGTVQEFPSAPRDSFMVTNLGYLDQLTHSGPNVVFAKTNAEPSGCRLAASPRRRHRSARRSRTSTSRPPRRPRSITTVDLLASATWRRPSRSCWWRRRRRSSCSARVAERRHEFATMTAIGGSLREVGAFVWSEAGWS